MPRPAGRRMASPLDAVAVAAFALLSAVYFGQATALAARAPFWMDEVLAVWTAQAPDAPAIWSALVRGAEFNPPLYDLFLHLLMRAGVTGALGLRLPSIVAIYVAALATGATVRRRSGIAPAALAAGIMLSSGLFGYAVQARPYALVTAAFALAVTAWDRSPDMSARRHVILSVLLAVAIGLNFYALLLAGALAVLEIARARLEARAPCPRTLMAIAAASASILAWWPILAAAHSYSAADVAAPDYYARPTLPALAHGYAGLLGWPVFPLIALAIVAILYGRQPARSSALATALVLSAVPVGVFAFALLVSGSYADRYALAGVSGIALLAAALVERLGDRAGAASVLLLGLLLLGTSKRDGGEIAKPDRLDALAVVDAAPGKLPIATGSGLRFLELREARPALARRLVFLDTPGVAPADPTNRHQVLRWKAIRPGLRVADARAFLCATPAFLLFAPRGGGADDLPHWLASRGYRGSAATPSPLTLVRTGPCKTR